MAPAWIGYNDIAREGAFGWVGEPQPYVNFAPREPNGGSRQNCVEMYSSGGWNDHYCTSSRQFVCQKFPLEYKYDTRSLTWANAESKCQEWGGHLARINSRQENNALASELSKRRIRTAWIGYNDIGSEGNFEWKGSFSNFAPREPNGHRRENCVELYNSVSQGKWNDHYCTSPRAFVCKRARCAGRGIGSRECREKICAKEINCRCPPFPGFGSPVRYVNICENQRQTISCRGNEVIRIIQANYGRLTRDFCPSRAIVSTNCRSGVSLGKVNLSCRLKRTCSLYASNSVFGDPCFGTVKYLRVGYQCVPTGLLG